MTHVIKYHQSNILYKKGNIVKDIATFIRSKSRYGYDILVPQCISTNINAISKLTKNFYSIFPEIQANVEIFISNPKNYGRTQFISIANKYNKNLNRLIFANMVCNKKISHKRKIDYILLARCMSDISAFIKNESLNKDNDKIHIMGSKFGTGFLGGNWSFIEQLVYDSWDGFTTTIYNYDADTN